MHAAADTLEALGFERGDYVVKVNNRKLLDGLIEVVGLAGDENDGKRLTVLRAVDKLDRLGPTAFASCWARVARTSAATSRTGAGLSR